ncbi:MAG: hypothetical protein ABIZ81_05220 [Opitutaceae bacterium]
MSLSTEEFLGSMKRNPISIGCAVLSLLLVGTVYFRWDNATELEAELDRKTTEADKLALNLKNAAQLKEQLDALVAAEKTIEARMIRAQEIPTNLQYFYQLETDTGVKLLDGSLRQSIGSKKDAKGAYQPTVFSMSVQGNYRQLLTFLRRLESGPRYSRVMSASCSSTPERGQNLVLSFNLELLGFP